MVCFIESNINIVDANAINKAVEENNLNMINQIKEAIQDNNDDNIIYQNNSLTLETICTKKNLK